LLIYSGKDNYIIDSLKYVFSGFTLLVAKSLYTTIKDNPQLKSFTSKLLLKLFKKGYLVV
jgi:hypothetical protein